MARYIDSEVFLEKLSKMIEYCKSDPKVTGLTALLQAGDAIMNCPTVELVHQSSVDEWSNLANELQKLVEQLKKRQGELENRIFDEIDDSLNKRYIEKAGEFLDDDFDTKTVLSHYGSIAGFSEARGIVAEIRNRRKDFYYGSL